MELDRLTIQYNEKELRSVSSDIDFNEDYKDIINKLKDYCSKHVCYALSPVQIGIPKRIIYIKNTNNMDNNYDKAYDESIIYINPVIKNRYGHTEFLEGCESLIYLKDDKVIYYTCLVDRPYKIEVEYYDENGNKRNKIIEGFEATVFSHEYDHLNGIVHTDLSDDIYEMTLDEMRQYRKENPYKVLDQESIYNEKTSIN